MECQPDESQRATPSQRLSTRDKRVFLIVFMFFSFGYLTYYCILYTQEPSQEMSTGNILSEACHLLTAVKKVVSYQIRRPAPPRA